MGHSATVVLRWPARKDSAGQGRLLVVLDERSVPIGLKVAWSPTPRDKIKFGHPYERFKYSALSF